MGRRFPLTEAEKDRIRKRWADPEQADVSAAAIGAPFGITGSTVAKLCSDIERPPRLGSSFQRKSVARAAVAKREAHRRLCNIPRFTA